MDQRAVLLIQRQRACHLRSWSLEMAVQGWKQLSRILELKRISGLVVALKSIVKIFHVCYQVQRYHIAVFFQA